MKASPLALLASCLLLGACSSPRTAFQPSPPPPPIQAGNKSTAWGELPSYDQKGHHFKNMRPPTIRIPGFVGTATLDILVNHDGAVRDVAILRTSGHAQIDQSLQQQFAKARYTLQLGPDDPAPYVVRMTIVVRTGDIPPSNGIDPASQKNLGGPTGPTQEYSTAGP